MFRYSCRGFAEKKQLGVHVEGKIYSVHIQFYNYQKIGVSPRLVIFSFGLVDRLKSQTHTFTVNVVFKTNTFDVEIKPCHAEDATAEETERYRQYCLNVIGVLYENTVDKKELCELWGKTDYSEEAKLVLKTLNILISGQIARAITKGCIRLIRFAEQ